MMTKAIPVEPLTEAAFRLFGDVARCPTAGGAVVVGPTVGLRPSVPPRLRWVMARPTALPLRVVTMERHEHSSQSFVPASDRRWLVLVAPHADAGGPDMARARCFLAGPDQAITYRPNVWHHPLTVLDGPMAFAVLTFLDDGPGDEEFVPVSEHVVDDAGLASTLVRPKSTSPSD